MLSIHLTRITNAIVAKQLTGTKYLFYIYILATTNENKFNVIFRRLVYNPATINIFNYTISKVVNTSYKNLTNINLGTNNSTRHAVEY